MLHQSSCLSAQIGWQVTDVPHLVSVLLLVWAGHGAASRRGHQMAYSSRSTMTRLLRMASTHLCGRSIPAMFGTAET